MVFPDKEQKGSVSENSLVQGLPVCAKDLEAETDVASFCLAGTMFFNDCDGVGSSTVECELERV